MGAWRQRHAHSVSRVGFMACAAVVWVACGGSSADISDASSDATTGNDGHSGVDGDDNVDARADGTSSHDGGDASADTGADVNADTGGPEDGPADTGASDVGADGSLCGACPVPQDVCCADPSSFDYGHCYDPACLACCQGGPPPFDAGASCFDGGACPAGDTCCAAVGSFDYGRCYPTGCLACCQGGPPPFDGGQPDAGGDAGLCGLCPPTETCCAIPGAFDYGHCYSKACLACCQ
jgi:hypothetical protein